MDVLPFESPFHARENSVRPPVLHLAHKDQRPVVLFRTNLPSDNPAKLASAFATKAGKPLADVNLGLWLDVRLTNDGALIVSQNELLTTGSTVGKPIELATLDDCKNAGLFELKDFAAGIEKSPTVLNLIARRPGLAKRILDMWGPASNAAFAVKHSSSLRKRWRSEGTPRSAAARSLRNQPIYDYSNRDAG
jgi:hypothetical protein